MATNKINLKYDSTGSEKANADLSKTDKSLKELTSTAKAVGVAMAAAAVGAGAFIKTMSDDIAEIDKFAKIAGVSVSTMAELGFVAQNTGLEMDDFADSIKEITVKMFDANNGSIELKNIFELLGVETTTLDGDMRDAEATFRDVIKALAAMTDQTKAKAIADLLGSDALVKIHGELEDGLGTMDAYIRRVRELGGVVTQDLVDINQKLKEGFADLNVVIKGVGLEILEDLAPAISGLTDFLVDNREELAIISKALIGTAKGFALVAVTAQLLSPLMFGLSTAMGKVAFQIIGLGKLGGPNGAMLKGMNQMARVTGPVNRVLLALGGVLAKMPSWLKVTGIAVGGLAILFETLKNRGKEASDMLKDFDTKKTIFDPDANAALESVIRTLQDRIVGVADDITALNNAYLDGTVDLKTYRFELNDLEVLNREFRKTLQGLKDDLVAVPVEEETENLVAMEDIVVDTVEAVDALNESWADLDLDPPADPSKWSDFLDLLDKVNVVLDKANSLAQAGAQLGDAITENKIVDIELETAAKIEALDEELLGTKAFNEEVRKINTKAEADKEKARKFALAGDLATGIANTAVAITEALKLGPVLGTIAALAIGAAGAVQVATIAKQLSAATGFDGVVDGPTNIRVGENGRERVSVTPLDGPNVSGPKEGAELVINFNGPITDKQYVREFIIPQVEDAVRKGFV